MAVLSKWKPVFDSHPKVDTIYVAADMPFLQHGQAASFAIREKVEVEVITREQVFPKPVVPDGDGHDGDGPDDTGDNGDNGGGPDDTGENAKGVKATGEATGNDEADQGAPKAKPAKDK